MSKKFIVSSALIFAQLGLGLAASAAQSVSVQLLVSGSIAPLPFWSRVDSGFDGSQPISSVTYTFSGVADASSKVTSQTVTIRLNNRVSGPSDSISLSPPSQCTIGGNAVSNVQVLIASLPPTASNLSSPEIAQFQQTNGAPTKLVLSGVGNSSGVVACAQPGSLVYSF